MQCNWFTWLMCSILGPECPFLQLVIHHEFFVKWKEFLPMSGFHTGGALEFPPPPQESWNWVWLLLCFVTGVLNNNLVPDWIRTNLWVSKLKFFLGGGDMPPDPRTLTCECAFARYYHPATILFPPNSKSCMKPWMWRPCAVPHVAAHEWTSRSMLPFWVARMITLNEVLSATGQFDRLTPPAMSNEACR